MRFAIRWLVDWAYVKQGNGFSYISTNEFTHLDMWHSSRQLRLAMTLQTIGFPLHRAFHQHDKYNSRCISSSTTFYKITQHYPIMTWSVRLLNPPKCTNEICCSNKRGRFPCAYYANSISVWVVLSSCRSNEINVWSADSRCSLKAYVGLRFPLSCS